MIPKREMEVADLSPAHILKRVEMASKNPVGIEPWIGLTMDLPSAIAISHLQNTLLDKTPLMPMGQPGTNSFVNS